MTIKIAVVTVILFFSTSASTIEMQRYSNWCWAASIQDVVAQAGYYESQDQVVSRLTGWPQNRPAYIGEVVALVRSYGLRAWQAQRPGSPDELYNTLVSGWKLIAFVRPNGGPIGHYIVLQGIDNYGNIITSDPATGTTVANAPAIIYNHWHWSDSVVVGR
jgi:hypothetical protein